MKKPAALARLPPKGSAPLVISVKPSEDPVRDVQRARAIAAGLAPRSVERLAELLENSDAKVALAAIAAIRQWSGPESRPQPSPDDPFRRLSDGALEEILEPSGPV